MAKISIKKKQGGTKVGNLLRKGANFVKENAKSSNLLATTGSALKPKAPVLKAPLNPGIGFKGGMVTVTQNGLTSFAKDTRTVANTKFISKPVTVNSNTKGLNFNNGSANISSPNTSTNPRVSNSEVDQFSTTQLSGAPSQFSSQSSNGGSLGSGTSSIPTTSVVNNQALRPTADFVIPEKGVLPAPLEAAIAPIDQQVKDATEKADTSLQDYLDSLMNDAPSSADAYEKAQRETQILQRQQEVNDLTGKLNGIVAKGEANQLSLIGQGRGIPEAIIGGQQAQIARETAIASLPVAAQLAAAQGNLEMANENLEILFKIYSDDARNEYEHRVAVKKAIHEHLTEKEKQAIEKQNKQDERDYTERQLVLKDIKAIATQAMQNQAPASVLSNIFKANSYQEAVQVAGKYGGDYLQRELLLQQIANVRSQISERGRVSNSYGTVSGKPQNAGQASANGYANRLVEADVIIDNLGKRFTGKLSIGGILPNFLQNNDRQMYEQAKRNFVTAILRRESGAAISSSEFITAERQYFPQAGDQQGVILQKDSSRNTAINNLYRESNVNRPVLPGQVIESDGVKFKVGADGETLELLQ